MAEKNLTGNLKSKKPGSHSDGGGLILVVDDKLNRRWVWRFTSPVTGKRRDLGLGTLDERSLAEARVARDEARKQVADGLDPIEERAAARRAALAGREEVPTFGVWAARTVEGLNLKGEDNIAAYKKVVSAEYAPKLCGLLVHEVRTSDVRAALEPHWSRVPPTAKRMRWLIEHTLDSARANFGHAFVGAWDTEGGNPARWNGHLKLILPKVKHRVRHFPSMPHEQIGAFMARLREEPGTAARALEFAILCAGRGNETRLARWEHIDIDAQVWTIPEDLMKKEREHRVALSARAVALLRTQLVEGEAPDPKAPVFCSPFGRKAKPLSNSVFRHMMRRLAPAYTPHGFRATFRNWGAKAGFDRDLLELCLSHMVGDETERSYWTDHMVDERRPIMDAWAERCMNPKADKVVSIGKKAAA